MSNDTNSINVPELVIDIFYIILGTVNGCGNFLLFMALLYYKALRNTKEYIILMCLALADALRMMAYMAAGVYQAYLTCTHQLNDLRTPRQCMVLPHFIIFSFSDQLAGFMLTIVSLDRLLFMMFPLRYISVKPIWAKITVITTYLGFLIFGTVFMLRTYFGDEGKAVLNARCYLTLGNPGIADTIQQYLFQNIPLWGAQCSVLLLLLTYPAYRCHSVDAHVADHEAEMKRQREFTTSILISTICTVFLFIIPFKLGYVVYNKWPHGGRALWIFSMTNPLGNICIFHLNHVETRMAVVNFLTGKHIMPENIALWTHPNKMKIIKRNKSVAAQNNIQNEDMVIESIN